MSKDAGVTSAFDDISWADLRQRRSLKWRKYPGHVLPSWVAEMDFPLADPIKRALHDAVDRDDAGYASFEGFAEALSTFLAARLSWSVDPGHISAVPDVMAGITESLRLLTEPGDGVVINTPVYPPFFTAIADAGRVVVQAPLARSGDGYRLDFDGLRDAFAAGARCYLLCSPHNPTGLVFPRAELEQVVELARQYDVAVLADEIHAPITLPGATFTPYLSIGPQAARRAVTLTSASKSFNLPGLKCAALIATDSEVLRLTERITMDVRLRTGLFGVLAAVAAFNESGEWLDDAISCIDGNRQLLGKLLAERLPEVRYRPPEASYLAWLDFAAYGLGDNPAATLLARGDVALASGPDFGTLGAGFARLNIATSPALLTEAVDRMATAVLGDQPMERPMARSRP